MDRTKQVSRLRLERVSRGWPIRSLAEKLGVTAATITNWETGKTLPMIDQAIELSRIYNVPVRELFFEAFNTRKIKNNLIKESKNE